MLPYILSIIAGSLRHLSLALRACFGRDRRRRDANPVPSARSSITSLYPMTTFAIFDASDHQFGMSFEKEYPRLLQRTQRLSQE